MDTATSFHRRLRALRASRLLTRPQLAAELNVNVNTIRAWESGRSLPKVPLLLAIARRFGVDVADLIDDDKPMSIS